MKLTVVVLGSRGDLECDGALAGYLADAGHEVRFVVPQAMQDDAVCAPAAAAGAEVVGVRGRGVRELAESYEARQLQQSISSPLAVARTIASPRAFTRKLRAANAVLTDELELTYTAVLAAAQGSDAVLCYPGCFPALDVAAKLDLPVVAIYLAPMIATRAFPAPAGYLPTRSLTALGNRATYAADEFAGWQMFRAAADPARQRVLGAPRRTAREALTIRRRNVGALVGVSPRIMPPRPADWSPNVEVCGYWFRQQERSEAPLDEATRAFLRAGAPPIFFGLGSMVVRDAQELTATIVGAAADAGVRLILQRGWAGLGAGVDVENIHVVDDVPHEALFEHVAAVVHHGGAGTTARGLWHGKPTAVIPVILDQFFWGRRIHDLGVGPEPLPLRRVSREKLAQRFAALASTPAFAERAAVLAAGLRTEDGAALAVAATNRFLGVRTGKSSRFTRSSEPATHSYSR